MKVCFRKWHYESQVIDWSYFIHMCWLFLHSVEPAVKDDKNLNSKQEWLAVLKVPWAKKAASRKQNGSKIHSPWCKPMETLVAYHNSGPIQIINEMAILPAVGIRVSKKFNCSKEEKLTSQFISHCIWIRPTAFFIGSSLLTNKN